MHAPPIVIIGAGTAGLSLAYHLRLPHQLYEREQRVGGLCRSEVIAGCTFDYAPRLLLPGDQYTFDLSSQLLGENIDFPLFSDWSYHHSQRCYTRFPIQKNLHGLPAETIMQALGGLMQVLDEFDETREAANYRDWLYRSVGRPIADMVIVPQERKKWKSDPAELDYRWAPRRVARPDLETALRGALQDLPHTRRFGYTRRGGIAALMEAFAAHVHDLRLGVALQSIDTRRRVAHFTDGSAQPYRALVATSPLPLLVHQLRDASPALLDAAGQLEHVSVQCVCLVVARPAVSEKLFLYYHDPEFIFHRVSVLSNLSPEMAPPGYSALVAEVSYIGIPPMDADALIERTRADMITAGLINADDIIAGSRVLDLPYAYPRPTLGWLENVRRIRAHLEQHDIYTLGRFGEWEYLNMHDIIPRSRDLAARLEERYNIS